MTWTLVAGSAFLPAAAGARSADYGAKCADCHGASPNTCNGCHFHGGGNVRGSLSKTQFAPGESVTVTVNAGTRNGWWRAAVLDARNAVLAKKAVASGTSTTLTVPAPQTAGTYTWKVAWYGSKEGSTPGAGWIADPAEANHGHMTAALSSFTVAAASAPSASLSSDTLAFGNVATGQSATRTTTLSNGGSAALSVTAVRPCSNTAPPYAIDPSAAFQVAAGASRTLTVTFAPSSTGAASGCFDLSTNDPAHATLRVNVSGAGTSGATPSASLTPASVDFGDVAVGQNATRTATVANSGTVALSVTGVTACDGSGSAAITVTPSAAFSVAAGASQALTVRFAPTQAGAAAACWNLATNDPTHATLQLRASGTGGQGGSSSGGSSSGGSSSGGGNPGDVTGGCSSAGGSVTLLALLGAGLAAATRRRRAR